jgi:glycosyltransferase involved in cell wall biosynthesis
MRVCIINHLAGLDGGERSMLTAARYLRDHGVEVKVIVPTAGPLEQALRDADIPYAMVRYSWWADIRGKPARKSIYEPVTQIVQLLRQWQSQVVYSNTCVIHAGAFAAMMAGLPHVWHARESPFSDQRFAFDDSPQRVCQTMGALSNAVICNSVSLADEFRPHVPPAKLHTVYNYVELEAPGPDAAPLDMPAPRLAVVGTVHPQKGQLDAVRALALVHQRGLKPHLLLIGSIPPGDYVEQIRAAVREHRLESHVHWLGFVKQPLSLLRQCQMTLVCSPFEPFGRVAVESLMLGVPVIGAASGGTRELVDEGVSGLLYPPGEVQALADRVCQLLDDPARRDRLAAAAPQAIAAKVSLENYGGSILGILQRAAQETPPLGHAGVQLYSDQIAELRDIKSSRAWKLVQKLWSLRRRLGI